MAADTADDAWDEPPRTQDPVGRALEWMRVFFTTGNVVVKVGVIVLIVGISFLLKFAADRNYFPIELRLAGVAAGGIALQIIGWRLRRRMPGYALVLQGGAVAILYLTVFTAARIYPLLPLGLALFIMVALVAFSCVLAVLQDSKALAAFASAGGFLAPVLLSTGSGSHVVLFSYYALLNAGILGIAWRKAWRVLNWIGFVFTFVIASMWGFRYYQPEYFATTEPFLVLFFLLYVAIPVLFAHRQPPHLKGLVDGTLVFGVPLAAFTLQSCLVDEYPYGNAFSALGMAAVYVLLVRFLWRRQVAGMRVLVESFLALGIVFATLVIPFALDGRWTAAAWALEGAGMTWIGIRQNRLLPRVFGLLLHVGGAAAFAIGSLEPRGELPVLNSSCLGCVLISIGGLFSGLQSYRYRDRLRAAERYLHISLLVWGLCWWYGAGIVEIDAQVSAPYEINATLFFISLSVLLGSWLWRRWQWPAGEASGMVLLVAMTGIALLVFTMTGRHPFQDLGSIAWITAFLVQYLFLYRAAAVLPGKLLESTHAVTLWLLIFMLTWVLEATITRFNPGLRTWSFLAWGALPAASVFLLQRARARIAWPVAAFPDCYTGAGLLPVLVYLGLWFIVVSFREADPAPLPYLPLLNPQDIAQVFAMLVAFDWVLRLRRGRNPEIPALNTNGALICLYALAFFWLNSVAAHAVHFYGGVRFNAETMLQSPLYQATISIIWTLTALGVMFLAARRSIRMAWIAGAVLLGVVVLKLFLVDLADSGTVARIVSFITVGCLMLVIGYASPLPPRREPAA